ncbi:MAG: UDP-N-acetylmuramoyl-L-alanine--D-glutamate ligase [Bacteroidetes bacterium]|nr:MAG: UDP-N-acetylmuramoyl-L-alanine--D-glutamate ligase [Bacteroidota bacterium]
MNSESIRDYFEMRFAGKTICLLGFGREGKSSYNTIRKYLPDIPLIIADNNSLCREEFLAGFPEDKNLNFFCGNDYLSALSKCDIVLKSPGVSLKVLDKDKFICPITSQTEIFLELFRDQVTGVTGTKGKSTTVSLLYQILKTAGKDVLLGGNIGIPPFEFLDKVKPETLVVFEMSSHQLENLSISPHVAVLLNIFQEHLDHYRSYKDYQLAKYNIARWQKQSDVFIYNAESEPIQSLLKEIPVHSKKMLIHELSVYKGGAACVGKSLHISYSGKIRVFDNFCNRRKIPGQHNITNILAAVLAAVKWGVEEEIIRKVVESFRGLPHRLEFIGELNGVGFYNDSISTIPESTIEALKTFSRVHTILLGGYDRGVDYKMLMSFLAQNPVNQILFIGKAGKRMQQELSATNPGMAENATLFEDFESAVYKAIEITPSGEICLLSPAAASYDMFKNFEHRGEKFRQIILGKKESSA